MFNTIFKDLYMHDVQIFAALTLCGESIQGLRIGNILRKRSGNKLTYKGFRKLFSVRNLAFHFQLVYYVVIKHMFIGKKVSFLHNYTQPN